MEITNDPINDQDRQHCLFKKKMNENVLVTLWSLNCHHFEGDWVFTYKIFQNANMELMVMNLPL